MSQSSTDRFLNRAAQIPLLTTAEEIHLGRLVQASIKIKSSLGDRNPTATERRALRAGRRAKDRMIMANIRLAVKFARPMVSRCRSMTLDDLIQEGMHGIVEAVDKFDPERGYKFSTYASWWIRQRLNRGHSAKDAIIKMPLNATDLLYRLRKHVEAFAKAHGGQHPSLELLAEIEGSTVAKIRPVLEAPQCLSSLDQSGTRSGSSDDSARTLGEAVSDDSHAETWDTLNRECVITIVRDCLALLPDEERSYMEHHYGINQPKALQYMEIVEQSAKSRWTVDRERRSAYANLRRNPVLRELAFSG
jgi:RNA polymerase primary sigma factor